MKCEKCQSEKATVFLTQIINGKMHKVDLCESCAKEMGVTNTATFSLADLLIKTEAERQNKTTTTKALKCPSCGFTQEDLSRTGRVGCGKCYDIFKDVLDEVLKDMQRAPQHVGKIPKRLISSQTLQERRQVIEEALDLAVRNEKYEDAAVLRDQLKKI